MRHSVWFLAVVLPFVGLAAASGGQTDDGFLPLFNGIDLSGWTGDTAGYRFEDDILIADPKGNLYTEAEYGDFVLRFEFKLTPGANNGIGIRVPTDQKASQEGMEIQILDDSAEKFAEAKPWQRHGSVYGVVPAKTGHLKPVGEWNEEEITVHGTRVKVVVNGAVIVDADLAPFRDGAPTPDGKKHPGLKRTRGHISLAGHGSLLYFRNMRIKLLMNNEPAADGPSAPAPSGAQVGSVPIDAGGE